MAIRRTSTKRIIAKPAAKRREAMERKLQKKKRRTSRKRKKTSKKTPGRRKTSREKSRRTSRVEKPLPTKTKSQEKKSTTDYEQWALAETHRLLAKWDTPGYTAEFSNRMTASMGKVNHRSKVITYSRPLFDRATAAQRKNTVIHEVAHAVVAHHKGREPGVSHGKEWKAQMRRMGVKNPKRTHAVDRTGLKRKRRDVIEVKCCGRVYRVTVKKLHRMLQSGSRCKCPGGGLDVPLFASKSDLDTYNRLSRPLLRNRVAVCGVGR